jgi:hypothetical protein
LSIEHRRTKIVYTVIQELVEQGRATFRPGDISSALRERGQPLGTWEVRAELVNLEADGLIHLDEASGEWSMGAADSIKATVSN